MARYELQRSQWSEERLQAFACKCKLTSNP